MTADGVHRPIPELGDIDAGGRTAQDVFPRVIDSLKISGGCIVRNFIPQKTVNQLNEEFAPYFDQAQQLKSK